jgi:class 3 adenylate cyclase/tetratricopeptide (TPR) repeat protein
MICASCGTENPASARFCVECGAALGVLARCASCGAELPAGAKFCPSCGTPVAEAAAVAPRAPIPVAPEERRVVTILFVDLVGFTERSDEADPEDVRRTLVPFHERAKEQIERFGGTLDKFIGDAAMGVFGAPIAHEDDPARAVRSGLAIVDAMEELRASDPGLAVRVAVNTGEALVSFGLGPQVGEAVAGDVVNTASRMQALAPRNSVVMGESTLRAIRGRFDHVALPPARVKGKSELLRVWRVLGERAERPADVAPTTFVGRDDELRLLQGLFDRAVRLSTLQVVTVVGEPGIGKTRLVDEFRSRTGSDAEWVTGRCVPYGATVTFEPVAEMVRAIAGIDAVEDSERAAEKLGAFVGGFEPDPAEREWVVSRLEPVLGMDTADGTTSVLPGEIAEALRTIVAAAARDRPVVVRFEDLQWAEPVLLEVVDAFAELVSRRPCLLVCTARPELFERHPGWGTGRANATTIGLPELARDETDRLLTSLLAQTVVPSPGRDSLLERAGGNPLYAVEFARMLGEQSPDERLPAAMPETVQAVIAARLDAIPAGLGTLVQDASVVGTAFWPGALAALGGADVDDVRAAIEQVVRRGLVERAPSSSIEGEPEYEFTHALIREVAYRRMPRARRAARHLAAGRWLEAAYAEHTAERAESLARHYAEAAELSDAPGAEGFAREARVPAVRWLLVAGERASRIDPASAFALCERALRLVEPGTREHVEALWRSAFAGRRSGRIDAPETLRRYEAALEVARALDDPLLVGPSLVRIAAQAAALGEMSRSRELLADAIEVLEAQGPGPELAHAYAAWAEKEMFAGRVQESRESADRALAMLRDHPQDEISVMALHIRGDARCSSGDAGGLDDLREALRIAQSNGNAADVVTSENYLGDWMYALQGPAASMPFFDHALAAAERRGVVSQSLWTKAGALSVLFDMGDWDRALAWCDDLVSMGPERSDRAVYTVGVVMRARIELLRGHRDAAGDPADLVRMAGLVEDLQVLTPALVAAALVAASDGDAASARGFVEEFAEATRDAAAEYRESQLAPVCRVAVASDAVDVARRLFEESRGASLRDALHVRSARAILAEADGAAEAADLYAGVAEAWNSFGNVLEEAVALLGVERLLPQGDAAKLVGERARELLAGLGVFTSFSQTPPPGRP